MRHSVFIHLDKDLNVHNIQVNEINTETGEIEGRQIADSSMTIEELPELLSAIKEQTSWKTQIASLKAELEAKDAQIAQLEAQIAEDMAEAGL